MLRRREFEPMAWTLPQRRVLYALQGGLVHVRNVCSLDDPAGRLADGLHNLPEMAIRQTCLTRAEVLRALAFCPGGRRYARLVDGRRPDAGVVSVLDVAMGDLLALAAAHQPGEVWDLCLVMRNYPRWVLELPGECDRPVRALAEALDAQHSGLGTRWWLDEVDERHLVPPPPPPPVTRVKTPRPVRRERGL